MSIRECSFPDCGRPHKGRELCRAHLDQLSKGKRLTPIGSSRVRRECEFPACGRVSVSRGLCASHRLQRENGQELRPLRSLSKPGERPACSFEGCSNVFASRGLCSGHARQRREGEELRPLRKVGKRGLFVGCSFEGCSKPHSAFGYCFAHANQYRKGKGLAPLKPGTVRVSEQQARAEMLAVAFSPSVPYPGALKPWPGVCLTCGHHGSPRLSTIRRGQGPCSYCVGNVIDDAILVGTVTALGFEPVEPFRGNKHRWRLRHSVCGQIVDAYRTQILTDRSPASGCPACAGKVVIVGWNDLATTHPDLAIEASFDPTTVTAGSNKRLNWECSEAHRWTARPIARSRGRGCPECAVYGFRPALPGAFYVCTDGRIVKGGISNTPERRLNDHRRQGLGTVLAVVEFETGVEAMEVEREWLAFVEGLPVEFQVTRDYLPDGFTEAARAIRPVTRFLERLLDVEFPANVPAVA